MLPKVVVATPGFLMDLTGPKSIQQGNPQNGRPTTCAGAHVVSSWCSSPESGFLQQMAIIRSLVGEYGQSAIWATPGSSMARIGKSYGTLGIRTMLIRRVQRSFNLVKWSPLAAS